LRLLAEREAAARAEWLRMNGFGKIHRCTDRNAQAINFYLYLAAAIVTLRQLVQRARTLYRGDTQPAARRLK
jgi:hypothetical protein